VIKVKTTIKDVDKGFKRLAAELGEMGTVTLGVQGDEAEAKHPNSDLTVGHLAAVHHLGVGVPQRPWLTDWMDANAERMMQQTRDALQDVMQGKLSRNQALIKLGYEWTKQLRDRIWNGEIKPPLAASTIARKGGETRPLLDSATLVNAITYKVFLPMFKSIRDTAQRAAARPGPK
jgi:hypothetical protein